MLLQEESPVLLFPVVPETTTTLLHVVIPNKKSTDNKLNIVKYMNKVFGVYGGGKQEEITRTPNGERLQRSASTRLD